MRVKVNGRTKRVGMITPVIDIDKVSHIVELQHGLHKG